MSIGRSFSVSCIFFFCMETLYVHLIGYNYAWSSKIRGTVESGCIYWLLAARTRLVSSLETIWGYYLFLYDVISRIIVPSKSSRTSTSIHHGRIRSRVCAWARNSVMEFVRRWDVTHIFSHVSSLRFKIFGCSCLYSAKVCENTSLRHTQLAARRLLNAFGRSMRSNLLNIKVYLLITKCRPGTQY